MRFAEIRDHIVNNPGFRTLEAVKQAGYRVVKERNGERYFLVKPVGAQRRCAPTTGVPTAGGMTLTDVISGSVGAIVRAFKSATTTRRIDACRGTPGAPVGRRNYWSTSVVTKHR